MLALVAQLVQRVAVDTSMTGAETIIEPIDFATAFNTTQIRFIAIFLAIDVILGIAAAIANKSFNFNKLATFMATGVLPYIFGFAIVEMVVAGFGPYGLMARTVIFVAIILNIIGSIIGNLATLGLNMPSIIKKST